MKAGADVLMLLPCRYVRHLSVVARESNRLSTCINLLFPHPQAIVATSVLIKPLGRPRRPNYRAHCGCLAPCQDIHVFPALRASSRCSVLSLIVRNTT